MNATAPGSTDLTVLVRPDSEPAGAEPAESSPADPANEASARPLYRKIARLPKPLRDLINSMLDDAAAGPVIIEKLKQFTEPSLPYPITEVDISRWRHSGYVRYLARQERLATVQINREDAGEMITAGETTTIPEATLQIIASQFYEFHGDFNPGQLREKLAEDPLKYTRFLNVFSRLVREMVNLRKYRQNIPTDLEQRDLDRDFAARELLLLVNRMDHTFKVSRPELAQLTASLSSSSSVAGSSPRQPSH